MLALAGGSFYLLIMTAPSLRATQWRGNLMTEAQIASSQAPRNDVRRNYIVDDRSWLFSAGLCLFHRYNKLMITLTYHGMI